MNLYKTNDMKLATVLSLNFPIQDISDEEGRGSFAFEDTIELQDMISAFWNKQLTVEPQALLDAQKSVKSRLYSILKK
jgi:hypothetical protein